MQTIDWQAFLLPIRRADIVTYGNGWKSNLKEFGSVVFFICFLVILLVIPYGLMASLNFSVIWIIIAIATIVLSCIACLFPYTHLVYEVRMKKFAHNNAFSYSDSIESEADAKQSRMPTFIIDKWLDKEFIKTNKKIIEGNYRRKSFKLGLHDAIFVGPGESYGSPPTAFLSFELTHKLPHIVIIGDNKLILTSAEDEHNRLATNDLLLEKFRVYASEKTRKKFDTYLSSEVRALIAKLGPRISIDIEDKAITFYQKGQFDVRLLPTMFEISISLSKMK